MTRGVARGTYGNGAKNVWEGGDSPPIDIPPNASGGFTITYQYWLDFLNIPAYRAYVNGVDVWPGAGWQQGTVSWIPQQLNTPQDCLNGSCVPATQYNTPGVFASLAECQAICTSNGCQPPGPNYCPPGKVCLEGSDWAQIEQLSSQLRSKDCG